MQLFWMHTGVMQTACKSGGNVLKEINSLIHLIKKKMILFLHTGNRCLIMHINFSLAENKFIEPVARNWSDTSSPLRKTSST